MTIKLSDNFTFKKLLRFTLPSIVMMVFTSIYGIVDGFFVSNFAGKTEFASVNFIMPYLMILSAVGFMFGTGGSALVGKVLGEGNTERASKLFSLIITSTIIVGTALTVLGLVFLRPVASLLGAEGKMLDGCVRYGKIIIAFQTAYMLQVEFQSFFVTAERPKLGLIFTLLSGIANMILDALFVGVFKWSIEGAAWATAVSQIVGGIGPIFYFLSKKNCSLLRLVRHGFDGGALLKTVTNGSSELMSFISSSVVGMLYNVQLMKYAGENGVASYGVIMYVSMIFGAIFIGYSIGSAPVISYHYGANNTPELKNLRKKGLTIITIFSVVMTSLCLLLASPLSALFVGYDKALFEMTKRGFFFFAFCYLFCGFAIFGSSFFTALNNGLVSAIISFFRTLVFQLGSILLLPIWLGLDGIWLSLIVAEFMAFALSIAFMIALRKKYDY